MSHGLLPSATESGSPQRRLTHALALEPNIIAVSAAMFLMGLGENLWRRFLARYLVLLGEPARKALIVSFAHPQLRARSVGLYYLIRSITIAPAAFVGGLLWQLAPSVPFFVAAAIGLAGTFVFIATVDERSAG